MPSCHKVQSYSLCWQKTSIMSMIELCDIIALFGIFLKQTNIKISCNSGILLAYKATWMWDHCMTGSQHHESHRQEARFTVTRVTIGPSVATVDWQDCIVPWPSKWPHDGCPQRWVFLGACLGRPLISLYRIPPSTDPASADPASAPFVMLFALPIHDLHRKRYHALIWIIRSCCCNSNMTWRDRRDRQTQETERRALRLTIKGLSRRHRIKWRWGEAAI